jgi:hypothetical protein
MTETRRNFITKFVALVLGIFGRGESDEDDANTWINKATIAPPTDASNKLVEKIDEEQSTLGYSAPTLAFPDQNNRHRVHKALNFAREAAGSWRKQLRRTIGNDVTQTYTIPFLGGTGALAQMTTDIPEVVTGRPVMQVVVSSDETRGDPRPAEAKNQAIAYQLMKQKTETAGYGHILLSNMYERYGYTGFLDHLSLFMSVLPYFDTADYEAQYLTGAVTRVEVGTAVDDLREGLEDASHRLFSNPWFVPGDWNWVTEPEESPLGDTQTSVAFALLPERFEGQFTDVDPDGAPKIEPETAPIDDAYVLVLRPINMPYIHDMYDETETWLFDELNDSDSAVGQELRRGIRLNKRQTELTDDEADEALEDLIHDLKNIEA